MLLKFAAFVIRCVLRLRYRIRISGLEKICEKEGQGILFLPNHPAMIDPVIVGTLLIGKFRPHILVSEDQIKATVLKFLVKPMRLLPLPDSELRDPAGVERMRQEFDACASVLKRGENILMYPAGRNYRSRYEDLQGNFGVELLLRQCPEARVVMIRTTGLWGSSFSRSSGAEPVFRECMLRSLRDLLLNLIFFMPRREVNVTVEEAALDFPRTEKAAINRSLESFYNAVAPGNTYVPRYWWERGGTRVLPEPAEAGSDAAPAPVPAEVRAKIEAKLRETASVDALHDGDRLGADLGMDSLMIFELVTWIQQEFGQTVATPEALRTVSDVMQGALGLRSRIRSLNPVPPEWFLPPDETLHQYPENVGTITEAYLRLAAENPDFPLLADQNTGVFTNRKIILSILALKGVFEKLPGERVGIIMPACAPFFVIFMATLFAGKVPVLLNWTVGARNLGACVRKSGVEAILSARQVIDQLESNGTDFSGIKEKIVYLEEIGKGLSLGTKLLAFLRSRFCWSTLRSAKVPETMAVLFTSGSESEPKAVPLTHANCISNVKYAAQPLNLHMDECILGMLPPFHSFGLLISVTLPAVTNMRTVFHANPTEGALLAKLISAYQATMIVGTPTFADGILVRATPEELRTIRLIVTGAEKCPRSVLEHCHEKCPGAFFLEGYGITECSPIVSLNTPDAIKADSIGHVIGCLDWMICGEDGSILPPGSTGMLFVSGPSIFHGYLAYDGPSPFTERDGKRWYRTGDLVEADEAGFITFKGRLKRFIKVAGEMVSLPAIEDVLLERFPRETDAVPLAVEAVGADDKPEIVLFTVSPADKNTANRFIREAGLSPIHYVERVVQVEEIPLLGTGKTDYRKLKTMI